MEVVPLPKSHDQLVGLFVEVSVNLTVNGAVPDVGEAVKLATGTTGELWRTGLSECQYRLVELLLASTTRPLALLTLCLVEVTLFTLAEAASRMTAVPRPEAKTGLSIGAVFS